MLAIEYVKERSYNRYISELELAAIARGLPYPHATAGCTFKGATQSLALSKNMLTFSRWKDQPLTIRCRRGKQSKRIASLRTITNERHCELNRIKTEGLNRLFPRQSAHIAASAWYAMRILLVPLFLPFLFLFNYILLALGTRDIDYLAPHSRTPSSWQLVASVCHQQSNRPVLLTLYHIDKKLPMLQRLHN